MLFLPELFDGADGVLCNFCIEEIFYENGNVFRVTLYNAYGIASAYGNIVKYVLELRNENTYYLQM